MRRGGGMKRLPALKPLLQQRLAPACMRQQTLARRLGALEQALAASLRLETVGTARLLLGRGPKRRGSLSGSVCRQLAAVRRHGRSRMLLLRQPLQQPMLALQVEPQHSHQCLLVVLVLLQLARGRRRLWPGHRRRSLLVLLVVLLGEQ